MMNTGFYSNEQSCSIFPNYLGMKISRKEGKSAFSLIEPITNICVCNSRTVLSETYLTVDIEDNCGHLLTIKTQ